MDELRRLRERIDNIDDQILDLLARRFDTVRSVIEVKHAAGIPVRIQSRIDQVIDRAEDRGTAVGVPEGLARTLYEHIVEATCRFEEDVLGADDRSSRQFRLSGDIEEVSSSER